MRTARLYVWFIVAGPVALLISSVLLTFVGPVVIEFAAIKRNPSALAKKAAQLRSLGAQLNAWQSILVVPDGAVCGAHAPGLTVIELSHLGETLRALTEPE